MLQDDVDSKEAHIAFLESEMQDAIGPSDLIIDLKSTLMDMMFEILSFEKNKGESAKTKASKNRVDGLINGLEKLNKMANINYNLKSHNRLIFAKYQMMRVENADLKAELKKIEDREKFLAQ